MSSSMAHTGGSSTASSDLNAKSVKKAATPKKGSDVWTVSLGPPESKIPRLQDGGKAATLSGSGSPYAQIGTPSSLKTVSKIKAAAGDAAAGGSSRCNKDTSPVINNSSPKVHVLKNAYEERIHCLQQEAATEKKYKSRLAAHGSDELHGASDQLHSYSSHHYSPLRTPVKGAESHAICALQQGSKLEMKLHDATAEVTFLVQQLDEAVEAQNVTERQLAASRSELTAMMAEARQLKQQVANAKEASKDAAARALHLQHQLDAAYEANQALAAELSHLQSEQGVKANDQELALAVSKAELALLQQQLRDAEAGKQAGEAAAVQLKQQLAAASVSEAALAASREEATHLKQQLADARHTSQAATAAVLELQQQLDTANKAQAALQECQAELQKSKQRAAATKQLDQEAVQTIARLQQQLQLATSQLAESQKQAARLQQNVAQAEHDSLASAALLLQLQQQLSEAHAANHALSKQVQELQQQVDDAQEESDAAAAEVQQLQQQLQDASRIREALATTTAKAEQLQQHIQAVADEKHAAATTVLQLQEELATAETRLHHVEPQLQASLQEAEAAKSRVEQLERALEWSQHEKRAKRNMKLEQQLKQVQKQLKDSHAAHAATRQQLQELQQHVQSQQAARAVSEAVGQQSRLSKDVLAGLHDEVHHDRCLRLQTQISDSRACAELLRDELELCRRELQQAKADLAWVRKHKVQYLLGFGRSRQLRSKKKDSTASCGEMNDTCIAEYTVEPVQRHSRLGGIRGLKGASSGGGGGWCSERAMRVGQTYGGGMRTSDRCQASDWNSTYSDAGSGLS